MTWRPELQGGCEAAKIAPIVVRYLQGRCLDVGSGPGKVWPSLIGIDRASDEGRPITDIKADATDLSMFADGSADGIFSSFLLHQIEREKVRGVLKAFGRILRIGGHLVLYLPIAGHVPDESDPDLKWTAKDEEISAMLESSTPHDWTLVEDEQRTEGDEYGHMLVYRKREDGAYGVTRDVWQRNPEGKKRALVIRYGAIGDAFVCASIFPGLKEQGYHLTVNCTTKTYEVLKEDPYVDDWIVQETDFVPNGLLGPYWEGLGSRYDHVINLCESVEGLLLALPGRLNHGYSDATRRALVGKINYMERTHDIASVPHIFDGRFYPTSPEREKARWDRRKINGPVVVWCVNGSSPHKVWPWTHIVSAWLLRRTDAHVMFYGDPGVGMLLQKGIMECLGKDGVDMTRVHGISGLWPIRRSLAFAQQADCIVGPETGPLNAMAMEMMPKVIYMSHSSADNLTKHWRNTTTLMPTAGKAPCYPCHRLHHTWEHCFQEKNTGAALCASSISPEAVFQAIASAITRKQIA